jgi:hypothetical protein
MSPICKDSLKKKNPLEALDPYKSAFGRMP